MKIKVCGMRNPDNIEDISQLDIQFMGHIFYEKSVRNVTQKLPKKNGSHQRIGVFVNAPYEQILETVHFQSLDGVQLHGNEEVALLKKLHSAFPNLILIKTFSVTANFNFEETLPYEEFADYFLFDTHGLQPGGNGITFNWELLDQWQSKTPYILSGGIAMQHTHAIKQLKNKPAVLDINSKFESSAGIKNTTLIQQFIQEMKSKYSADEAGFYGEFGGAFVPEMLYPNVQSLKESYKKLIQEPSFQEDYKKLLQDYVGRPTPLYFSKRLSAQYGAKIYLKREDLCHTGAHKINNTIGQILLAQRLGKKRIIAETGAGQHGVATATVCALMGLECVVYMGEIDMARQAPNVARMKMLGATVKPATSGSKTLKDATNEAIRDWIANPTDTFYIIGSVVGPAPYPEMVAEFQSVISEEIKKQLLEQEQRNTPDYVIACVGGGSNAAGAFYHFIDDESVQLIAAEAGGLGADTAHTAATTFRGTVGVIHGSKTLLMQTEDGQITEPYSISAGLDYPGVGPLHAHLFQTKRAKFFSINDDEALAAGLNLCKKDGIIPAIESSHALAVLEKMTFKKEDVLVVNLSGRGDKDLETYINYFGF